MAVGTAAQTTTGMGPEQMGRIASLMGAALRGRHDEATVARVRAEVEELCAGFPPYPALVVPAPSAGRVGGG